MDMNLKAFMKEELKNHGTMEFDGIDKFTDKDGKPIPLIVKRLSMKEVKDLRKLYRTSSVYRDRENGGRPVLDNGQVAVVKDFDVDRYSLHLIVDALVQPKLDDPELMAYYGVDDRLDMPDTVFADRDDFKYVSDCVAIACGIKAQKKDSDVIDEVKN